VVRVVAQLKIDVLESGWVEVPLRLADAGVISAHLVANDGSQEPARLAVDEQGGYKLLVENKTKATRQVTLRLEYAKPFNKAPGRNDVSFAAPQAPVNRLESADSGKRRQGAVGAAHRGQRAAAARKTRAGRDGPISLTSPTSPKKATSPKKSDQPDQLPQASDGKAPEETVLLASSALRPR